MLCATSRVKKQAQHYKQIKSVIMKYRRIHTTFDRNILILPSCWEIITEFKKKHTFLSLTHCQPGQKHRMTRQFVHTVCRVQCVLCGGAGGGGCGEGHPRSTRTAHQAPPHLSHLIPQLCSVYTHQRIKAYSNNSVTSTTRQYALPTRGQS